MCGRGEKEQKEVGVSASGLRGGAQLGWKGGWLTSVKMEVRRGLCRSVCMAWGVGVVLTWVEGVLSQ